MFGTSLSREEILHLLELLPPVTAVVTWCVLTDQITADVIDLADNSDGDEYDEWPLLGMVSGWNPSSTDGLRELAVPMIEAMYGYARARAHHMQEEG